MKMYFEWMAFFSILALLAIYLGQIKFSFAWTFAGGIMLLMMAGILFAEGWTVDSYNILDLGQGMTTVTPQHNYEKNILTSGLASMYITFAVGAMLIATINVYNAKQKGW